MRVDQVAQRGPVTVYRVHDFAARESLAWFRSASSSNDGGGDAVGNPTGAMGLAHATKATEQ